MNPYTKFSIPSTLTQSIQAEVLDSIKSSIKDNIQSFTMDINKNDHPTLHGFLREQSNFKLKESRVYISYPGDTTPSFMTMNVSPSLCIPIMGYKDSRYDFFICYPHLIVKTTPDHSIRGLPSGLCVQDDRKKQINSTPIHDALLVRTNVLHSLVSSEICAVLHITWQTYETDFNKILKPLVVF